jgi:hypothetical protein
LRISFVNGQAIQAVPVILNQERVANLVALEKTLGKIQKKQQPLCALVICRIYSIS